jgi:hypothetical protein
MAKVQKILPKVNLNQPFVYRGITIKPTAVTRSARTREFYDAMVASMNQKRAS